MTIKCHMYNTYGEHAFLLAKIVSGMAHSTIIVMNSSCEV